MAGAGESDLFGDDLPSIPRVKAKVGKESARPSRNVPEPSHSQSDSEDPDDMPRPSRKRRSSPPPQRTSSRPKRGRAARIQAEASEDEDVSPDAVPPVKPQGTARERGSSARSSRKRRSSLDVDEGAERESRTVYDDDEELTTSARRTRPIPKDRDSSGARGRVGKRGRGIRGGATAKSSGHTRRLGSRESSSVDMGDVEEDNGSLSRGNSDDMEKDSDIDDRDSSAEDKGDMDVVDDAQKELEDEDDDESPDSGGVKPLNNPFEDYSEDDLESQSEEEATQKSSGSAGRLTMRQRALQGEDVGNELETLTSPRHKKRRPPVDELTKDDEMEMKKQQKARLRHMVHEKRNKEKRAAMVDKVLRGVTSKRKKLSLATEAHVAKVGSRLTNNEARQDCVRYISGKAGASISIPTSMAVPSGLSEGRQFVAYPPSCARDPKTGKRILHKS